MNNIWIATDWHLWNTEYDDGRHKFKSITRLGQLADEYTSVIGTNDLFIHLGDLCDPSNTKPEKLKAIIQSIPGTKILCRGNHDTELDEYYLSAGFDHVCEILKIHDLVFSHKPVNVGVDQINIHGHLHTRKLSTLDGRYLNAYDVNYSDKPILLEDLLQHAVQQTKADYAGTEVKQDKIDKIFDSIENDHYENILDLSEEFSLDEQFIQESTQMKSNIDKDFKSKGTKSLSDFEQVKLTETLRKKYSSTYKMLRHEYADGEKAKGGIITSIAWLDDDNLVAYTSVLKRDDGIYIESLEVTNDYKGYGLGTQLLNYAVDTLHGTILGVAYDNEIAIRMYENKGFKIAPESKEKVESGKSNNYLMIKESSIAPMLHSLSATEIEKDEDPLDEVIFEDPEDTIYWEQDDTDPKLYKEKEPMAEAVGAAIMTGMTIASGASNVNSYFNNWYKQNEITDYVIFGTSEQKMYKCIDKTFKFKSTAERAADQVDRTFIYLRTSNNLNKKQKERYDTAKKYWSKVKKEYKAANESVENINEAVFNDEPDIYYNKDKFDANKTNKMLIVGFSGSGKSTMSYEYENDRNTEIIHLDEVYQRYDYYNEYNLKEISSLVYTFFIKDIGRRYWRSEWGSGAELIYDFMIFADKYADKNKGRRFIIEGVWPLYDFEPDFFDNWAVMIKGTARLKSIYRAAKRQYQYGRDLPEKINMGNRQLWSSVHINKDLEPIIDKWREYFSKQMESMNESIYRNDPDIYYNKDLFDSGEINLCYIIGLSGSGKTTLSKEFENISNIEIIHLDDINKIKDNMSINEIKRTSGMLYEFYNKYPQYYFGKQELDSGEAKPHDIDESYISFFKFAESYAASHKNVRYILEGVWTFYYLKPEDLKQYAVYIKGTSALTSFYRGAKRGSNDIKSFIKFFTNKTIWNNAKQRDKQLESWKEYYNENTLTDGGIEEATLTVEHLAELHKAHPELSTILPDDGKDIHDPTKYYCSKAWIQDENVIAAASIRYPQANSEGCYSKLEHFNINENYCTEDLAYNLYEHIMVDLGDNRLNESPTIWTNDPVDIYDRKYEVLEEATKGTGELYPVYVFIVNSGSTISRAVEWYTGDKFTHAAISFEPSLNTMYSFGIKQENGKGAGFSVESINNKWYKGTDKQYAIYCVFVTKSQLKKMKDRVNYFINHGTHFMFNLPGLVLNAFNISFNPKHAWFCSQFVADIINAGNTKNNTYIKDNSYMRPNDFTQTNFAHYICGGIIKNFRVSVVKAQTLKAMEQEKNARMLRGKKPMHYTVQRFQENAAELSPATREDMNKLNAKWDLRPIGYGDRDKYIAEEEEKLNKMREHNKKLKEIKDKNKQKLKAAKKEKQIRKLKIRNEEVYDPFNALDQDRFFDWNDYHNTVLGENSFKLELADKNFQFLNGIMESATGNDKLVPVFVVLTHSYSAVSRMVKAATGDEYTHASISFDTSLTNMYTFGRTADRSVFEGSFKIEDVRSDYYQKHNPPIPYGLFCVPVTEAEKNKMLKKINYFAKNKDKFSFDFFGLFINAMGIPNNPKNRYFCSRFVSEILNAGDPKHPLIDEPSLQHPQSFVDEDFVRFVCSGDNIAVYDQSVADRVVKDIMRTEKLVRAKKNRVKNENFLGINPYNPFTSDVLHYKFAMLDENEMNDFMNYLESFKIQYDKNDNIIISRKEYNQLEHYINTSIKLCNEYNETGNIDGIKEEMAKTHYMIQLINNYYLSPSTIKNPRVNSDLKKEFIELRSVMLSHFNAYIKWIKIREPNFNFQSYYDTSKYSNTNMTPTKVLTAVDKVLVTAL